MNKSLHIILSIILFVSGCATYQKHPDFIEKQKKFYSVAVMPPEVEVYKLNFKGDKELLYDLIPKVKQFSKDEIENVFRKKGYVVQKLDLGDGVLQNDHNLRQALFNVNTLFDQKLGEINKRKQKKFIYSLGAEVNQFADIANSDILIFTKESGYKKTGGEIAKGALKSLLIFAATLGSAVVVYYPSIGVIQTAVVDSNTGDILWYHHNLGNTDLNLEKENSVRGMIRSIFSPFPKRVAEEKQIRPISLVIPKESKTEQGTFKEAVSTALDSVEEKAEETVVTEPIIKTEEAVEALPAPVEDYRNIIIERIKTQLPPNYTPLSQPVWLHMSLLKSGAIKELGVLKDKSNPDKEIQRVALKSVDKALPLPAFPQDIAGDELNLDIKIE